MGSDSDWPIMKAAAEILSEFEVEHQAKVVSAHRTPDDMVAFAKSAESEGFSVIIAGAGGAAHLPGMVASCTTLPVIGVPIAGSKQKLDGMDSLLSIVQMPKGIPVATVAINNATNAALLAIRMLAISDQKIRSQVAAYAVAMAATSRAKTLE
ncbi:MAG: 5-(carboxyamino)imidazole ribonucleotide mutase [Arenicella sp.]|jgi:5-(carboxyamino)imidazole ribonucleotide mutase